MKAPSLPIDSSAGVSSVASAKGEASAKAGSWARLDPFENDVVHDPRDRPESVKTLNEDVLNSLVGRFETRPGNSTDGRLQVKAELVLSPAPGYGKSHLIGRLFDRLAAKVIPIYLPPFETLATNWQSVLYQIVDEMERLESKNREVQPTHLENFAEAVLRRLLAGALRGGSIRVVRGSLTEADLLDLNKISLRDPDKPGGRWIRDHFLGDLLPIVREQLRHSRVRSTEWPRVLFQYLSSSPGSELRYYATLWLRGEALDQEAVGELGISKLENPRSETAEVVNETAWQRLADFCRLSSFYRPFLFCFDQLEGYLSRPELIQVFGRSISRIVRELPNQFTLVTANQANWDGRLRQNFDQAVADRFSMPRSLRGLNRREAEQFIDLRLKPLGIGDDRLKSFKDGEWLYQIFVGDRAIAPREFSQRCSARWKGRIAEAVKAPIDKLFEAYLVNFKRRPDKLKFEPDVFRWLVNGPWARDKNIKLAPCASAPSALEIEWHIAKRAIIVFGFLREGNHLVWRNLADFATEQMRRSNGLISRVVLFRTPELGSIPRPGWVLNGPFIRKAIATASLVPLRLTADETAELYAARNFYNESVANNVDGCSSEEVFDFLTKRLKGWRDRFLYPIEQGEQSQSANAKQIKNSSGSGSSRTVAATRARSTGPEGR